MDLAKTRSRAKYETMISMVLLLVPASLIFQAQTVLDTLLNPEICAGCHLFPTDTKKGLRQVWIDLHSLRLGYQFCLWLSVLVMFARLYILCRRPRNFVVYRFFMSFRVLCWGGIVPLLVSCSISTAVLMEIGQSYKPEQSDVIQVSDKLKEYLFGLYVSTLISILFDSCTAYSQLKEIKMVMNPSTSIVLGGVSNHNQVPAVRRNQVGNATSLSRSGRNTRRSETVRSRTNQHTENTPTANQNSLEPSSSLPRLNPRRRNLAEVDSHNASINRGQGMLRQAGAFDEPIHDNRPTILDEGQPVRTHSQVIAPPLETINLRQM